LIPVAGAQVCPGCRAQFIESLKTGSQDNQDAGEFRRSLLHHEGAIRALGILWLLGGTLLLTSGAMMAVFMGGPHSYADGVSLFSFVAIGVLGIVTGICLGRLMAWARVFASIVFALGLLLFPGGTLVNAAFLYLLWGKNGRTVFSPEYRLAVIQTPEIRATGWTTLWAIGLVAGCLAGAWLMTPQIG